MVEKEEAVDNVDQLNTLFEQARLKEAKNLLRYQPTKDYAATWKAIIDYHTRSCPIDSASIYWDTVQTCFGSTDLEDCRDRTPKCVDTEHLPHYALSQDMKDQVCRLVTCFAYNSPDIPFSPLLYACAAILRTHLSEEDSFAALSVFAEPPKGIQFLTQTRKSWDIMCNTLYPLAQKFLRKRVTKLESLVDKEQVKSCFNSWPWWIFELTPTNYLHWIFTCFLLEGNKVLYRFALALLKSYTKQTHTLSKLNEEGLSKSLKTCITSLKIDEFTLIQSGFKIPRFSKTEILKLSVRLEMELKSNMGVERRRSNAETISPDAANQIVAMSDTLSYKQLQKLWLHIPERVTMVRPKLVFSSNNDGTSLRTFYLKSEHYEPSLLVIKTRKGDIFGAYCSSAWKERNEKDERGMRQLYFGTGETFLFKVAPTDNSEEGVIEKFGWVGEGKECEGKGDRAEQLFMSGNDTMISIGGGEGTGIYLDENLEYGRTETCKTFQNPCLASSPDFTVSVIEVIGFQDTQW